MTDLTRSRMDTVTEKAEQASAALARGDSKEATQAAREAEPMFRELARHVEGLLADETARRVASARDLAGELAQHERELGDAAAGPKESTPSSQSPPGDKPSDKPGQQPGQAKGTAPGKGEPGPSGGRSGSGDYRDSELAERAARLGESGRTLDDLLKAIAQMDDEADSKAAEEIQRLLDEGELAQAVARMAELSKVIGKGDVRVARVEANELAEYLEAVNLRLDALYRSIVMPRIAELMALERRAADLRSNLEKLDSEVVIDEWHREANDLVRDVPAGSAGETGAADLLDAMHEAGWGSVAGDGWNWTRNSGYYAPPPVYVNRLDLIVEDLQRQIGELLLRDLISSDDGATPPEYRELVERYFTVLSQKAGNK